MFEIGSKVGVSSGSEYRGQFSGMTGTVADVYQNDKVGVRFEGLFNPNSKGGLYWFHKDNLVAVRSESVSYYDFYERPVQRCINNHLHMMFCPEPKKVIFSGLKTIVLWEDGAKTIVSCGKDDLYDPYTGFCAAVTKKLFGSSTQAKKILVSCQDISKLDKKESSAETEKMADAINSIGCTSFPVSEVIASRAERAKKMADDILNFVNGYAYDTETFSMAIARSHRTLQQSTMRLFVETIRKLANVPSDDRNAETVSLAKDICELIKDRNLPFI